MNLIAELEKYREQKGLKKADMARLFGVDSQNYNNWVYRNSLPKEFYEKALSIIGAKAEDIISLIVVESAPLSDENKRAVLEFVQFLGAKEGVRTGKK